MLRALAANGGVAMVNFMAMMVDPREAGDLSFMFDTFLHGGQPAATVANVVDHIDHIDHIVEVAGIDHVGLGSDFDGSPISFFPRGLRDVGDFPNVTLELVRRGYSTDAVRKILGENVLRVLGAAEAAARTSP